MFHPDYLRELMAIGEADAELVKDQLDQLLAPTGLRPSGDA